MIYVTLCNTIKKPKVKQTCLLQFMSLTTKTNLDTSSCSESIGKYTQKSLHCHVGYNNSLQILKWCCWMWLTVVNVESVVSTWQSILKQSGVVDASVEFAKIRKCGSAHPDNEILVLITIVLWIIRVEFIHRLLPVRWMCRSVERWTTRHIITSCVGQP